MQRQQTYPSLVQAMLPHHAQRVPEQDKLATVSESCGRGSRENKTVGRPQL